MSTRIKFVKSWAQMSDEERAEFRRLLASGGFGVGLIHVGDVNDPADDGFFAQFVPFELSEAAPELFVIDTQGFCKDPIALHASTKFTVYESTEGDR